MAYGHHLGSDGTYGFPSLTGNTAVIEMGNAGTGIMGTVNHRGEACTEIRAQASRK